MGRIPSLVLGAYVCLTAAAPLLATTDRISVQDEIANLTSTNTGTRHRAVKRLGKAGRLEAIPALNEAVRDPEVKIRRSIVDSLRSFESPQAIEGLIVAVNDEDKKVRYDATRALGEVYLGFDNLKLGKNPFDWLVGTDNTRVTVPSPDAVDARVVNALVGRLNDEEKSIRRLSAFALGSLRASEAVGGLTQAMLDPVEDVRLEAVDSLGLVGGSQAGDALRGGLSDGSKSVRAHAVDALGEMRYMESAPGLVSVYDEQLNKDLGDRALRALARMGAPEARGVFYYQMTSSDKNRRRWAVEGIGRLGDDGLVSALIKDFLREPASDVQLAYCFSLTKLGQHEFVDRVVLSLADSGLRRQAREYAIELGSPLLGELVAYLNDPVPEVRREMTDVLVQIGDLAAIPYLEPLIGDENTEVADHANRAVSRLKASGRSAENMVVPNSEGPRH